MPQTRIRLASLLVVAAISAGAMSAAASAGTAVRQKGTPSYKQKGVRQKGAPAYKQKGVRQKGLTVKQKGLTVKQKGSIAVHRMSSSS